MSNRKYRAGDIVPCGRDKSYNFMNETEMARYYYDEDRQFHRLDGPAIEAKDVANARMNRWYFHGNSFKRNKKMPLIEQIALLTLEL